MIFIQQTFQTGRMNKLRFLSITVVLLLLLNVGTLVYLFMSQKTKDEQVGPPGRAAADFIIQQLKLNDQQQQQFAALRRQHQDITRQVQNEDRRLHDEYFGLLKTDNPDKIKADSISLLIAKQRSLVEAATFDHFQQLRKLCNDDQKKLFDSVIDEVLRMMAPKGPHPGGPPPPPR